MYDPTKPYKKQIFELIEKTWDNPYVTIKKGIYPILKKKFNWPEVDHSDGIGTKGLYHWQKRTFKNAVLDGLAMNLNDLALMRAIPYKLQNHIIIPEDDNEAILAGAHGLQQRAGQPVGHARALQAGAEHEERRDRDHRRVAEPGECLGRGGHAREPHGQHRGQRDHFGAQPAPRKRRECPDQDARRDPAGGRDHRAGLLPLSPSPCLPASSRLRPR